MPEPTEAMARRFALAYWGDARKAESEIHYVMRAMKEAAVSPGCRGAHAPWCSFAHDGPCPAENEVEAMRRGEIPMPPVPGCRGAELAETASALQWNAESGSDPHSNIIVERASWHAFRKALAAFRASGEAGPDQ